MESWNVFVLLMVATSLSLRGWCYVVPASDLGVGSPCRLPTGRRGACKLITDCPAALAAVRQGTRIGSRGIPTRCGFQGSQEIVCCEADARSTDRGTRRTVPTRPTVSTGKPPHIDSEWVGRPSSSVPTMQTLSERKSEIACRNYAARVPKIVSPYITGGTVAKKGEFPHMAVLGYPSTEDGISVSWDCGGTLISDRYVITAAHCLFVRKPNVVRLGELDLTTEAEGAVHVDYAIEQIHSHPLYDGKSRYHDIGLIRLNQTVPFTEFICPACLYSGGTVAARNGGNGGGRAGDFNDLTERKLADGEEIGPVLNDELDLRGKTLLVSGWGRTEFIGDKSAVLLKADLLPYASEKCKQNLTLASGRSTNTLMPRGLLPSIMMCAGDPVGDKDTCLGDSGGPIQFQVKDSPLYTVVGITSFGDKCGYSLPAIYTRVSYYLDWIEGIVWRGAPPY